MSQKKTMTIVLKIMRKADMEVEREEIRVMTPIVEILSEASSQRILIRRDKNEGEGTKGGTVGAM